MPEQGKNFFCGRDLHVSYGRREVLKGASFSVDKGSLCGLLGPNGAGKSTLFKCCMNFISRAKGQITIDGAETRKLPPAELSKLVAYVPQEHRQAFPYTVREMVSMGRNPRMRGLMRLSAADKEVVEKSLFRMGIEDLAEQPVGHLSGGQRQLTLIARALAQEAPLMLLDEPTAALDFSNQITVWRALKDIAAGGVTVLVCCHDPNHIMWFCDSVLVMSAGEITMQTTPDAISKSCMLSSIYGENLICGTVGERPVVYPAL